MKKSLYQQTVRDKVTISGIGVHSGAPATLVIEPAPANSGITFIRTDILDKNNVIAARWDNVIDTRMCTVLGNAEGVSVGTVEHLLSAFAVMELDNAVVRIDGPEIPIMDGSSVAFVDALRATGLSRQNAARRVLRIKKTVSWQEGDKEAFLSPADETCFSFEIAFAGALIGRQKYTFNLSELAYRSEIAAARTFGFLHEVEQMRKMGLARGGSLENAVVVDGDTVMNPDGLRWKNEFVRHKILDAIGDIALGGATLLGHYHGYKAGHALNNKLLRVLFSDPTAYEFVELPLASENKAPLRLVASTPAAYAHTEAVAVSA